MRNAHLLRFAVGSEGFINSRGIASRVELDRMVRRAEELGYAIFLVSDHFANGLTTVATLMAAADAGKTIRIGSFVFDNDFRHPAQLAKEVATLDLLSGGRCELGIGAGWYQAEYDQVGLPFDRPGIRIERLAEAITIIKQFFTKPSVNFAGTYYRVTGLESLPKSPQQPHPPIFIGGGGKRVLTLAAQQADIVGIVPMPTNDETIRASERTEAALERKVSWIREAAGEQFATLELNIQIYDVAVTEDRRQAAEERARKEIERHPSRTYLTPEAILADPFRLIGNESQIVERIRHLREAYGISYFMIDNVEMEAMAPVVAQLAGT